MSIGKINPWKFISSKIVYQSPYLTVREDRVINPNGYPDIHNVVYGGNNNLGGVCVAAIDNRRNVFLIEQYRYAQGRFVKGLVGGGIESGETPLKAAKRELLEEAGVKARHWIKIGEGLLGSETLKVHNFLFLATEVVEAAGIIAGENSMRVIKVPLAKAVKMVLNNEVELTESSLLILMVDKIIDHLDN